MKRILVSALFAAGLLVTACEKEKDDNHRKASILGKWRLEKIIDEEYKPIDVLLTSEEEIGKPGDSVVFRNDNTLLIYEEGGGPWEDEYQFIGDDKIEMEGEVYTIVKLTDTEFHLLQDETDRVNNERWVYKIFLLR